MQGLPLKLELRIDWSDIDLFGHINNLAILRYVQAARVNYLEIIGLMQSQAEAISVRFWLPRIANFVSRCSIQEW
jgi:acyl-CoA thioesterase FadM